MNRIHGILSKLKSLDRSDCYTGIFPRLDPYHSAYLGNRGNANEIADALREAAGIGPLDVDAAFFHYVGQGVLELKAAKEMSWEPLDYDWNRVYREAAQEIQETIKGARALAVSCDREGVPDEMGYTWAKTFSELQEEVELLSELPACQRQAVARFIGRAKGALERHRKVFEAQILEVKQLVEAKVQQNPVSSELLQLVEQAEDLIRAGNFLVGPQKIWLARKVLLGESRERKGQSSLSRLPASKRDYPSVQVAKPLRTLLSAAKSYGENHLGEGIAILGHDGVAAEVKAEKGFIKNYVVGGGTPATLFKYFKEWLGIYEDARQVKDFTAQTPNLQKGAKTPYWQSSKGKTKAIFLLAQSWKGAPFYTDDRKHDKLLDRVLCVMFLDDESGAERVGVVTKRVESALGELSDDLRQLSERSEHEQQFFEAGLVVVLTPGDFLARINEPYSRYYSDVSRSTWENRVAFIDELDLLRILPVPVQHRYEAFLQMVLPRFKQAHSVTYRSSQAVNPHMFFGREDVIDKVKFNATVLFSGRKMGKSSLLKYIFQSPGENALALWVPCSGIASWRSWHLLNKIGSQLTTLLHDKYSIASLAWQEVSDHAYYELQTQKKCAAVLAEIKPAFEKFLADSIKELKKRGCNRLFLLLDEADGFVRAERIENAGRQVSATSAVSWFLKDLETVRHQGFLRVIFAGFDEVGQTDDTYAATGNWGSIEKLGPLAERDALDLIRIPLASLGIMVDEILAARILDYTSGHASLIQLFCARLVERVARLYQMDWPLNDFIIDLEDVEAVMDADDYQRDMRTTLEMNLNIGRLLPLKLLFYAIVSPTGLGRGHRLNLARITFADVERQLNDDSCASLVQDPMMIERSLDLLCNLGLLRSTKDERGRDNVYSVQARHYAGYLRTRNNFSDHINQARRESLQDTRETVPRQVWTITDDELRVVADPGRPLRLIFGLEGSGQDYLATLLAQGRKDSSRCKVIIVDRKAATLHEALQDSSLEMLIVLDRGGILPWQEVAGILYGAKRGSSPAIRWLAGPKTCQEFVESDDSLAFSADVMGMGPITHTELEVWAAQEMGQELYDSPGPNLLISDADRESIIGVLGGLLPVMERWREYLGSTPPDPIELRHAERFCAKLAKDQNAKTIVRKFSDGIPSALRCGIRLLFQVCHSFYGGMDGFVYSDDDLIKLQESLVSLEGHHPACVAEWSNFERWISLLEVCKFLGFIESNRDNSNPWYRIPTGTALGALVLNPNFCAGHVDN